MSEAEKPESPESSPDGPTDGAKQIWLHLRIDAATRTLMEERVAAMRAQGVPAGLSNFSNLSRSILQEALQGRPSVDRPMLDAGLEMLMLALQRAIRKASLLLPAMVDEELRLLSLEQAEADVAAVNARRQGGVDHFPLAVHVGGQHRRKYTPPKAMRRTST